MGFPYETILCPLDFDDCSLAGLDKAIQIARYFKASIALIHVVSLVLRVREVPIIPPEIHDRRIDAKAKLTDIAQNRLADIEHETAVYVGDIAESIIQAVADVEPDLLVMATHGRAGLAHLVLGSVAESVVRKAGCPVLTIRGVGLPHLW
jgi:nucleotide-binding universal stress UspA family protein